MHTAQQLECLPEIELVKSWAYETRFTEKGMIINTKAWWGQTYASEFKNVKFPKYEEMQNSYSIEENINRGT